MAFPNETKTEALIQCGARCECTRKSCGHLGRCEVLAQVGNHHFHHKTAVADGGDDSVSNCEVLCIECHQQTKSYGRHP